MGWRPSTDMDAVVVALLDGPRTIAGIVETVEPVWEACATGDYDRPPALNYQSIYQRVQRLKRDGRLIEAEPSDGTGTGRRGAMRFRLLTAAERDELLEEERRAQEPDANLRAQFREIEDEMQVSIMWTVERHRHGYWWRDLRVRTHRGDITHNLWGGQSWADALVEVGLA